MQKHVKTVPNPNKNKQSQEAIANPMNLKQGQKTRHYNKNDIFNV